MKHATYLVKYEGQVGHGGAVLYIGNGAISGADVGGAIYRGSYEEQGERIRGKLKLTQGAVAGVMVTGISAPAGSAFDLDIDFPRDFANGKPQTMMGPGNRPIRVIITKIQDLPELPLAAA